MKNRNRVEIREDQRLPTLLVLGLFICLLHLAGSTFKSVGNQQASNLQQPDTLYVWLAGENIIEGVYRLPRPTSVTELYSKLGISSLKGDDATSSLRLEPFLSLRLAFNGPQKTGLHPRMAPFFFQPIPINTADVETLTTISGIGPKLAHRIVELREQRGGFRKPKELLDVSGIGKKKLAKLRREVRFN